jgi:hypothetical protein
VTALLNELQEAVEVQSKRTIALQAQLDHLDAKVRAG